VRPFWVEDEVGWGGGGELLKLSRDYGRCVSICFYRVNTGGSSIPCGWGNI